MQNLNALIHLESLAEPMSEMMSTIQSAEQQMKIEIEEITNIIKELRVMIYIIDRIELKIHRMD